MAVIPARGGNLYWHELLIQMTNPKTALHWIAIVGIGLGAGSPLWVGTALVFSTTMDRERPPSFLYDLWHQDRNTQAAAMLVPQTGHAKPPLPKQLCHGIHRPPSAAPGRH